MNQQPKNIKIYFRTGIILALLVSLPIGKHLRHINAQSATNIRNNRTVVASDKFNVSTENKLQKEIDGITKNEKNINHANKTTRHIKKEIATGILFDQAINNTGDRYLPYLQIGGTHFITKHKPDAATGLDLLVPLWQASPNHLIFTHARLYDPSGKPFEGNIHLGYRHLLPEKDTMYGIYGAFDRKLTGYGNYFNQLTFGAEVWVKKLFVGGNIYHPIGKSSKLISVDYESKTTDSQKNTWISRDEKLEKVISGGDIEAGYEFTEGLIGYIGGYYFGARDVNTVSGPKLRVTYDISLKNGKKILGIFDKFGLETGVQTDRPRGTVWYLSANFKVGLPNKNSNLQGVAKHMVDLVRRDSNIVSLSYVKKDKRLKNENIRNTQDEEKPSLDSPSNKKHTNGNILPPNDNDDDDEDIDGGSANTYNLTGTIKHGHNGNCTDPELAWPNPAKFKRGTTTATSPKYQIILPNIRIPSALTKKIRKTIGTVSNSIRESSRAPVIKIKNKIKNLPKNIARGINSTATTLFSAAIDATKTTMSDGVMFEAARWTGPPSRWAADKIKEIAQNKYDEAKDIATSVPKSIAFGIYSTTQSFVSNTKTAATILSGAAVEATKATYNGKTLFTASRGSATAANLAIKGTSKLAKEFCFVIYSLAPSDPIDYYEDIWPRNTKTYTSRPKAPKAIEQMHSIPNPEPSTALILHPERQENESRVALINSEETGPNYSTALTIRNNMAEAKSSQTNTIDIDPLSIIKRGHYLGDLIASLTDNAAYMAEQMELAAKDRNND